MIFRTSIAILFCSLWILGAQTISAQDLERCEQEFSEADQHYVNGAFDQAINLLQACLNKGELGKNEAVAVYRLMGLSYINKGDLDQARLIVLQLLSVEPMYEPDRIQDPPSYVALVNVVKEQVIAQETPPDLPESVPLEPQAEPPKKNVAKKWVMVVGGAIVVGAAVAIAFLGGTSPNK